MNDKVTRYEVVPIRDIQIADRIRQDDGDIDSLADDIQKNGLINPITVMKREEGGYLLIAGVRRLKALKRLGESEVPATVMSPMEASEALVLEISENEKRKDFTPSERLAYAELLKESESQKAKARMLAGKAADDPSGNCRRGSEKGRTADIVAHKVGFGSERQLRRAQEISEKRPDLMEAIDKGEHTIHSAYSQMKEDEHAMNNMDTDAQTAKGLTKPLETKPLETKPPETKAPDMRSHTPPTPKGQRNSEEPNAWVARLAEAPGETTDEGSIVNGEASHEPTVKTRSVNGQAGVAQEEEQDILKCMKFLADKGFIPERKVHIPSYEVYWPDRERASGDVRSLKGADHEHLMENHIYSKLYDAYTKAVQDNNRLCGYLRRCCQSYERIIRGDNENIQACQREILKLRAMLGDRRAQQQ